MENPGKIPCQRNNNKNNWLTIAFWEVHALVTFFQRNSVDTFSNKNFVDTFGNRRANDVLLVHLARQVRTC